MAGAGIDHRSKVLFTPVDTVSYTVSAGADGYVDTDCSAGLGTDTEKSWVINCSEAAAGFLGARQHGSALDPKTYGNCLQVARVDSSGHLDLYRLLAGDTYYNVIGYFK